MKISEIREKNKEELKKILVEKQGLTRKLRFDLATKQVKNTKELRTAKRDIAKILTKLAKK
ncbi:MAG: 50S ribosomal protein L29 [Candidatus Moranbacteria bacterium]|nr:50S ribosomal protein L29 [Candidatus Moranbacteria bacterium]